MNKAFGNIQSDHPELEALAIQQSDRHRSLLVINKSSQDIQVNVTETNPFLRSEKTQIDYLDANGVRVVRAPDSNLSSLRLKSYSVLLLRSF